MAVAVPVRCRATPVDHPIGTSGAFQVSAATVVATRRTGCSDRTSSQARRAPGRILVDL